MTTIWASLSDKDREEFAKKFNLKTKDYEPPKQAKPAKSQ